MFIKPFLPLLCSCYLFIYFCRFGQRIKKCKRPCTMQHVLAVALAHVHTCMWAIIALWEWMLTSLLVLNRSTQIKTYSWDNAQVILAGNKCDMEEERVVSSDSGRLLAEQLGKFTRPNLIPKTEFDSSRDQLETSGPVEPVRWAAGFHFN